MDTFLKALVRVLLVVCILVVGSYLLPKPSQPAQIPAPEPYAPPIITMAEYQQVKQGMSYAEVVAIIGSEGRMVTELVDPSIEFDLVTRAWDNPGKSFAQFTFDHGVVSGRLQVGLE